LDIGHLDLKNLEHFYIKVDYFKKFLKTHEAFRLDKTNKIYVEEALKSFAAGGSMAQVISLLTAFNAACRYVVYEVLATEPTLLNVSSARKKVGLKIPKKSNTKKCVLDFVKAQNVIPENIWQYKKTGNPKDYCFDMADSFVIAKARMAIFKYLSRLHFS